MKINFNKNGNRRKTIKGQILTRTSLIVMCTTLLVGTFCGYKSYVEAKEAARKSFQDISATASLVVKSKIDYMRNVINEFGSTFDLYVRACKSNEEINKFLNLKASDYGLKSLYITDTTGKSNVGYDFKGYDFYESAVKGTTFMTKPIVNKDKNTADIMLASPLWENGIVGSKICGTVIGVLPGQFLSDITNEITVGDTGTIYI